MQTRYPGRAPCGDDSRHDHNREHGHDHRHGHHGGSHHYCNRCDAPQGDIVTLNGAERVCGACIDLMGSLLAVASRVAVDMTPSIECHVGCGSDRACVRGTSWLVERGLAA